MDVTEKAKGQASKRPGLVAPGDESQVQGPRPVTNNAWGHKLSDKMRSPSLTGRKK